MPVNTAAVVAVALANLLEYLVRIIGSAVAAPHNGSEGQSTSLTTTIPPRSVDSLVDVPCADLSPAFHGLLPQPGPVPQLVLRPPMF